MNKKLSIWLSYITVNFCLARETENTADCCIGDLEYNFICVEYNLSNAYDIWKHNKLSV